MMPNRKWLSVCMATVMLTAFLSGLAGLAGGGDVSSSSSSPPDITLNARPLIQFNKVEAGEHDYIAGGADMNGTAYKNHTGEQADVYVTNMTFRVNVTEMDNTDPDLKYINNITLVAYVNFDGDPGDGKPITPCTAPCYDKRNYEFQLNATRVGGTGNDAQTYWDLSINYPTPTAFDDEVEYYRTNSSWVNETNMTGGGSDTDATKDTIEIRWTITLGNQSRHTNASGADSWNFYATACDIYGQCNSTNGKWAHTFDVYANARIRSSQNPVSGREVPGGDAFLLNTGEALAPESALAHRLVWAANNNATFEVNATDPSAPNDWSANTLNIATSDLPLGAGGWISLGADYTVFSLNLHPFNGTSSKRPGTEGFGEAKHRYAFWSCDGIPSGVPGATYTSTVTYRLVLW